MRMPLETLRAMLVYVYRDVLDMKANMSNLVSVTSNRR
jgi:hypothetical protein